MGLVHVVEYQNMYIQMYKGDVKILKQKTFHLLEKNLSWALHEHSITGACLMSGTMGKSINKGMLIIF